MDELPKAAAAARFAFKDHAKLAAPPPPACISDLAQSSYGTTALCPWPLAHLGDVEGAHGVAVDGGEVQGQVAVGVARARVAAALQQQAHALLVPVPGGVVQAGAVLTVTVAGEAEKGTEGEDGVAGVGGGGGKVGRRNCTTRVIPLVKRTAGGAATRLRTDFSPCAIPVCRHAQTLSSRVDQN